MEQQRPWTSTGMPSRPARRRWFQSCRVSPMTVCPWACSIAATVEESTPPDMAIAMVWLSGWLCIWVCTSACICPTFHDKWSAWGARWWKSEGGRHCRLKELGAMVEQSKTAAEGALSGRWALPFLGVACAVGVASLYYNQPLLTVIGHSLGQDARHIGFVAVATQVGYAAGLLFFVPLGDVAERRGLMLRMYLGVTVALVLAAFAQNLPWMI